MQTLFVEKRRVALEENSKINTSSRAQETNYPHANCLTHCVDLADGPEYKNHSPGIIDVISMQRRNRLMRSGHPDACPRRTKKMMMQRVVEFLAKLQEKRANTNTEFQNQSGQGQATKSGLVAKV